MKSKAAIALGPHRPLVVDEVEVDGPREGEVLVEVRSAGLCHTDLLFLDGSRTWNDYPMVLGHEAVGVALECGPGVRSVSPGDHVIPVSIPECGVCPACRSTRTNLCDEFFKPQRRLTTSWRGEPIHSLFGLGTFSQYVVVPEIQTTVIRRDAPMGQMSCMGCAGMTGLGSALFTARVEAGSTVAVFGLGGIGLNVVDGARMAGASKIIGIDVNPEKEGIARAVGLTHFIQSTATGKDLVAAICALATGGVDFSFECVGQPDLLRQAIECTRKGWGATVSVGGINKDIEIRPRAFLEGRTLTGSMLGNVKSRTQLPTLVDWYVEGRLKLDNLISHRIGIDDVNQGFELVKLGQARRVVIDF